MRATRSALWVSLAVLIGFPAFANAQTTDERIPGVTTAHPAAARQTTAEIMARQAATPPRTTPRFMPEFEFERDNLAQNPAAPAVAQWPPRSGNEIEPLHVLSPFAPQTIGVNVTGATLADTGAFPPDSMGTVGPTQFVVFVNGRVRTFSKSTGAADGVINADPDVFFASVMTPVGGSVLQVFTSDPQVRYDRLSGRWFLSIIDVPCTNSTCSTVGANRWLLAVSNAASAGTISGSTSWTFFYYQTDAANFCDYPSLGVDANALYFGCDMFTAAGAFGGTNGYVVRKTTSLGAGPLTVTKFANMATATGAGPYAPRGVDNYDPSSNEGYFIGSDTATYSTLMIRRVSNPGSASPTISGNISLTVPTTTSAGPVTHLGNTGGNNGRLDALDDRLFAAHIRNGRLWTAHNFLVSASGVANTGAAARNAVRWYELNGIRSTDNGGTPVVVQSGTIFDSAATLAAARQFWIPSVMVSGQGHAALGYSTAGTPNHADAATSGRLASDTAGTTQAFVNLTTTASAYNPASDPGSASGRRWGDYSYTSVDPLDDMTMWTVQEFCDATNSYGVRFTKLIAPPPATPASAAPAAVCLGSSNVNVVITGTSSSGSGFFDPGANLASPALAFSHITASVSGTGVTVNSVTYTDATHMTLNVTVSAGAAVGARNVVITNPDGQIATGTGILTVNAIPSTPTASNNGPICAGGTLNLTTPTVAGAAYAWTGPNGFTSTSQNPSIVGATTAATGTYSITITVSGCPSAPGTTTATVNAAPATPTAANNGPICAGSALNLTTPTVAGATYAWTGPNGFSSTSQNPSIANATTAATGTYSVTVTMSGCTSAAGTTAATVNAKPATPTAANNGPICAGSALNLTTPTVAGATYAWTGPNSFSSASQNPSIANATVAATGTYSVTVTVSGCTSAAGTTAATVNAIPSTPTAANNGPICAGSTLNLTTPTVSGATYAWTGPNSFSSALQNPSIANATTAATGTYSVTVTMSGCTSAAGTTAATVNAIPSTPTASNNGPICAGATLNLSTPTVGGATYAWTGPNSFVSASQNPSIASATTAASGTYSVTVAVSGCTSAAGTTSAAVNADTTAPTVTAPGSVTVDQTVCCGTFGGATSAGSTALATFVAAGSAVDDCTASPTKLAAQIGGVDVTGSTCFEVGATSVTFRFQDAAGHIGTASSSATVRMFGDLNLDRAVDPSDMVILRAYFNFVIAPGTAPFNAPLGMADLNHDAVVDPTDSVIFRAYLNFVVTCLAP